ncbi:thialysine N-epsilon-acetyltransferase-like isoform X1 [Argopecten irradians]|uniref:thialysine N-epsilon-acetyltransferase-like isoform X1 n=1 Tax=Argopecten irradians TaxID=31199 RepID=UPI003720260D
MSGFHIRPAVDGDIQEIYRMATELAVFLEGLEEFKTTEESLRRDRKYYECFVVEDSSTSSSDSAPKPLIGYAMFHYTFSSWDGRAAFLNDMYVSADHRGKGIGKELLKTVAKDVLENGCEVMDWWVLDWNSKAIEFYKSHGAINLTELDRIHTYRMSKSNLEKLAS